MEDLKANFTIIMEWKAMYDRQKQWTKCCFLRDLFPKLLEYCKLTLHCADSSLWKKLADHGDKVRQLKGSKAVKATMIAEVNILLYLKIELSLTSQSYGRKKEK